MISPEDRAMLERLGKEAQEVPNFYPGDLLNLIRGVDFHVLYDICLGDDGKIDMGEDDLMFWFYSQFEPRLHGDYGLQEEAFRIIYTSFCS